MTSKKDQPELTVNLQTTLRKFGGFIKVIVFIICSLGVGAGGKVGYDKLTEPEVPVNACSVEIEKRLSDYNARLIKVETRIDNTDLNILEIKSSLVRIETYLLNERDRK